MVARKVRMTFPKFQNITICRVDVARSNEPVFANTTRVTQRIPKHHPEFFG